MRARTPRRRALGLVAGLAAFALLASGCAGERSVSVDTPPQVDGPIAEDTRVQLEGAVTHAMAAAGASGAIVGVWVPWSGSWVAGLGTTSVADATPVSVDMAFRIGDVTRPMICDVLYGVAADGMVSLDDSVSDYVSGVPNLEGVTLLELCNGTSGIGSYEGRLSGSWLSNPDREWSPRELASYGLGAAPLAADVFTGTDTGYVLLGLAMERATNKSAPALITQYVADPLDLDHTFLPKPASAPPAKSGPVLDGHYLVPGADGALNCAEPVDITTISSSGGFTDSGATSTIADLGRYGQALASGALATGDLPDRWAGAVPASADGPSWAQAVGGAYLAGSMIGQYGSFPGYLTSVYSDPATGMTVAVTLNNSTAGGGLAGSLAYELAAIASKAPAASGQTAPEFGLPWTAQQFHDAITQAAVCPVA